MSIVASGSPLTAATTAYQLRRLTPAEVCRWDELIAPYGNRELFHESSWLDYLATRNGIEIARWAIQDEHETVGYFCGGILRVGPFPLLGSPLRSWGTNVMGPLVGPTIDQPRFIEALDCLARAEGLAMIELEHPVLSGSLLAAAQFEPSRDWTYLVKLAPGDPEAMWRALQSTSRNRIRKAYASNLTVEDTDDPGVVDEFYDLHLQLMRRKGRRSAFPPDTPWQLFAHLKAADRLFTLRVKDAGGRVLAVGLFPHDDRTMYFWNSASRADGHPLCPNDYLHWSAMRLAASRGLGLYNMSGYGRFKRKFGGVLTEITRWHKSYWRTARWARQSYRFWSGVGAERILGRGAVNGARARSRASHAFRPRSTPSLLEIRRSSRRPSFRPSDVYRAPLHDFPIRDELLYQYLPMSGDMDLLEIGPGSGLTAFRLAREVRSITLLDVASANIARLRSDLGTERNLRFVCADVCEPGLPESLGRTFDAAYALEVFELLPDPGACLQNLAGVIRAGGHLLLQFPNYPPSLTPGMTYFKTRQELDGMLDAAGFSEWRVGSLRLTPYARLLYEYLHEKPIRAYRRRRSRAPQEQPLIYDESWAFQEGGRLEPLKVVLHVAWAALSAAMRLGGPAFTHRVLGSDILNHNLIVLARR